ncbi:MAG: amino acid ABC transporter permease [Rhodocyclaceae bacterium]|nr:amino acid ABC transporter permease [Rhodocyclaceae bacterium]
MDMLGILQHLAGGVVYTVLVTLVCSLTGLAVGLSVATIRRLSGAPLRTVCDVYTYLLRGVPVLVLLFIVYFGLPGIGLKVPPLLAMALSLGLISSAYLAEIFRGALDSVDPVEVLAAQAMGMTRFQIFWHIEMPQMLRFSLPGMVNEFTSVLKYSPFAYTVGIPEITKEAITLTATTLQGAEIYLVVGILYFSIYRILLVGVRALERYFRVPGIASL